MIRENQKMAWSCNHEFLPSVSVCCFTCSIMIILCYRQVQRIIAANEYGNFEVFFRSGIVWLTGSQRQAEKISLILQRLHTERKTNIMNELSNNTMVRVLPTSKYSLITVSLDYHGNRFENK